MDMAGVVVIDAGSSEWRGGFAGDEGPSLVRSVNDFSSSSIGAKVREVYDEIDAELESMPLILSEAPGSSAESRRRLLVSIFAEAAVPSILLVSTPLLFQYHLAITTGVIVDIGATQTRVTCFHCGYALLNTAIIVEHLVCESACASTGRDFESESTAQLTARGADGLFERGNVDTALPTLPKAIFEVVKLADVSLREALLSNVMLVGGGSLLEGCVERLQHALAEEAEAAGCTALASQTRVSAKGDRRIACWMGGATLGLLSPAAELFVTRAQCEAATGVEGDAAKAAHASHPCTALGASLLAAVRERTIAEGQAVAASDEAARAASLRLARSAAIEAKAWWMDQAPEQSRIGLERQRTIQCGVVDPIHQAVLSYHLRRAHLYAGQDAPRGFGRALPSSAALTLAHMGMRLVQGVGKAGCDSNSGDDDEDDKGLRRSLRHALVARWASAVVLPADVCARCEAHRRRRDDEALRLALACMFTRWAAQAQASHHRSDAEHLVTKLRVCATLGACWAIWQGRWERNVAMMEATMALHAVAMRGPWERWRGQHAARRLLVRILRHFASRRLLGALVGNALVRCKNQVLAATAVARHSRARLMRWWPIWAARSYEGRLRAEAGHQVYFRSMDRMRANLPKYYQRFEAGLQCVARSRRLLHIADSFAREVLRRGAVVRWRVAARFLRVRFVMHKEASMACKFHTTMLRRQGWRAWRRFWAQRRLSRGRRPVLEGRVSEMTDRVQSRRPLERFTSVSSQATTTTPWRQPGWRPRSELGPSATPTGQQDAVEQQLRDVLAEGRRWAERLIAA